MFAVCVPQWSTKTLLYTLFTKLTLVGHMSIYTYVHHNLYAQERHCTAPGHLPAQHDAFMTSQLPPRCNIMYIHCLSLYSGQARLVYTYVHTYMENKVLFQQCIRRECSINCFLHIKTEYVVLVSRQNSCNEHVYVSPGWKNKW